MNAAIALAVAACGEDDNIIPDVPDKPTRPTIKNDTVRMDIRTIADFDNFQKRSEMSAPTDSTYIANVRGDIPADSLDLTGSLASQHKDASARRITNWGDYGIAPAKDTVHITDADHEKSGNLLLTKNKSEKSFFAATEQDSIAFDKKGYTLRVIKEKIIPNATEYNINSAGEISDKVAAILASVEFGNTVVANIAGRLYVTTKYVSDLERLEHPSITLVKQINGEIVPNEASVNIDGNLLKKYIELGLAVENKPNYFLVPRDKNLDAVKGKGMVVRTDQADNLDNASWAIPQLLNLNGNIRTDDLSGLSKFEDGKITVSGNPKLESVSDESLGWFSSPAAPNSGKPFVFESDPVILSLGKITAANDSVDNMSVQKLGKSFWLQNPDLVFHSIQEYYYYLENEYNPNAIAAVRPARLTKDDIKINWYNGKDFIDDSWNDNYKGLIYVSYYNFEKLALYFGIGGGKIVNNNDKTLIVITDDNEYQWLHDKRTPDERRQKLESLLPGGVEWTGTLKHNNYSWPLYLNKKIRIL